MNHSEKGMSVMLVIVPLLIAMLVGSIMLLSTWWFKKMDYSLLMRGLPGTLTVVAALLFFYIGYFEVRGFAGAAYLLLALFLSIIGLISLIIADLKRAK